MGGCVFQHFHFSYGRKLTHGLVILADGSIEEAYKALFDYLAKKGEVVCVLKSQHPGSRHDEIPYDQYYVIETEHYYDDELTRIKNTPPRYDDPVFYSVSLASEDVTHWMDESVCGKEVWTFDKNHLIESITRQKDEPSVKDGAWNYRSVYTIHNTHLDDSFTDGEQDNLWLQGMREIHAICAEEDSENSMYRFQEFSEVYQQGN